MDGEEGEVWGGIYKEDENETSKAGSMEHCGSSMGILIDG